MSDIDRLNDQLDALHDASNPCSTTSESKCETESIAQDVDTIEMDELIAEFKSIVKKSPIQSVLGAILLGVLIGRIIR